MDRPAKKKAKKRCLSHILLRVTVTVPDDVPEETHQRILGIKYKLSQDSPNLVWGWGFFF